MVTMTNGKPATAPTVVRELDTPAASALAHLAGMLEDMHTVLRCCERLVSELSNTDGEPDDLVIETLWTTALLCYERCFSPGKSGMALSEDDVKAIQLQGDVLEWHKVLHRLREHYADTATNPRESFSVGVSQDSDGSANGIAITSARQPPVDDRTVRQTGAIAFELSRVIDTRITEHQETVFNTVQVMSRPDLDRLPLIDVSEDEPDS